jgi:hypothetical protein
MELVRQKNVATIVVFPIVDADGDLVTGASGLDSEIDSWSDAAAPDGFADCTNEATEIASTGMYYLSLAQAEMNADYIVVQVKTSTSGAKTQVLLIRTMVGDPLNIATTDDGGTINVASGVVEANALQLSGDATAADNLEAACDGGTYNVGGGAVVAASVAGAVGSVTGAVGSVTGAVGSVTGAVGSVTAKVAATLATGDVTGNLPVDVKAYTVQPTVTGATLAADQAVNVTKIAGSAVDTTAAQLGVNVINWKSAAAAAMTGDAFARLGAPAGASVSADVAAVKSDAAAVLADTGTDGVVVATASKTGYALSATGVTAVQDGLATAALLPTDFATVTVTDAKIDANATATLTEDDIADIADAVIAAIAVPTAAENRAEMDANSTQLAAIATDAATAAGGSGATSWSYTVTDSDTALPIADVEVWLTTDAAGVNVVARQRTNASGVASFMLTAGSYYVWRYKSGYTFTNPDSETVS